MASAQPASSTCRLLPYHRCCLACRLPTHLPLVAVPLRAAAAASRRVVAETCGNYGGIVESRGCGTCDNCGSISIAGNCGSVAVSSFAAGGTPTPDGPCVCVSWLVLAINCCCIARGLGGWDWEWEPRAIRRYDSSRRRSTSSSTAVSMSWFSRSWITPQQPRTGSAARRLDS